MNLFQFLVPKSLVETIDEDASVRQTLEKMRFHRYSALPVLDREGKYVGTVKSENVLTYFLERGSADFRTAERDSVLSVTDTSSVKPLFQNASIRDVLEEVKEHNFVPVVDDRGCFIGIILRREILTYLLRYLPEEESKP